MTSAQKTLEKVKIEASEVSKRRGANVKTRIIVGTATCGVSAGANQVVEALKSEVAARKLDGAVVLETGCSGRCDLEPLVQVLKDGQAPALYFHIDADKARRIVQQHVQNNDPIHEWILT